MQLLAQEKIDLSEAFNYGAIPLYIPEPVSLSQWADKHFYLSPESSSIEGRWESLPYQKAILDWIGHDDIRILSFQKSARVGYTKMIMAAIGYFAEHKKRNQVVYQPTDSDAADFTRDEIDPMLRDVEILRKLLKVDPEKKSQHNTREKKNFIGSTLDIKGGKSGRNYRRLTRDCVFYDEIDGFDLNIDGEGSPLSLGDTRIATSSFPKSIRGSTPRVKGLSLIESSLSEADMVFYRYIPCPDCGEMQTFEWKNFHFEKGDPASVRCVCVGCGVLIEYNRYPDMDAAGQWRTEDGIYYDEGLIQFFDQNDEPVPPPDHIGVNIWAAYSYFSSWQETTRDFFAANKAKKKGDLTKLITFVNTRLAQTWEERGERVEDVALHKRVESYNEQEIPEGVLLITMGVDVQSGKNARLELEIVGWGIGDESWSLDYVVLEGNPERQEVWGKLDEQRARRFMRYDGIESRISSVCIDSGHKPQAVYHYVSPRHRQRVFATKGSSKPNQPIVGRPTWQGVRKDVRLFPVGTDTAKDILYERLRFQEPGPGYCHFPAYYAHSYFKGLTSEEKVMRFVRGVKKIVWKKVRERNEPLDCRVLSMAALAILKPNLKKIERRLYQLAEAQQNNHPLPKLTTMTGRRVRSRGLNQGDR